MTYRPDSIRAALLLTNRLVELAADPLTAREFWQLLERVDPADLVGRDAAGIAELTRRKLTGHELTGTEAPGTEPAGSSEGEATRLRTLLDAATALSFEEERLSDGGIALVSALDDRFPARLRERLGTACPPFLLVAGPIDRLGLRGLGIVGSPDANDDAMATARDAARLAAHHEWTVIGGLARGVAEAAMAGAFDAGGSVVGIPAEGILVASRRAEIRRRVHAGELCIASPYAPNAPLRAAGALGRNKIVDALSQVTFVIAAERDRGGAWAGATEALDRRYVTVAVWAGAGAPDGNHALIARGATPITDLSRLFEIDTTIIPSPHQESLF